MNSSLLSVRNLLGLAAFAALCGCDSAVIRVKSVDDYVDDAAKALSVADLDAARAAVSNAYALAANDVDVRLLKAQLDFHSRDYASAAKFFKGVAEDASLDRQLRAQGWAGLGVVDHYSNERDAARINFLKALRLDRKNASAWYHLGLIYHNSFSYFEAASDCYETYVRLEPVVDERALKVQRSYIPTLREARTASILEIPGARSPNSADCTKALQAAEAAVKKGQLKTARLRYEDAVKADPTSFPAAIGLAKLLQKSDSTAEGRKRALEFYCRACKLSPSSISTFIAAADFAVATGNQLTARELYSRAMAADPTSTTAIDGLIRTLRKLGQSRTAALYQGYRDFLAIKVK